MLHLSQQQNSGSHQHGLIVAHKPGSGKTISALRTIWELLRLQRISSAFVIVPNNVVGYWEREAARLLGPDMSGSVFVMTHRQGLCFLEEQVDDAAMANALLVVDEAHNMRTRIEVRDQDEDPRVHKGKMAAQFVAACHRGRLAMLLTGTPVVNNIGELANLLVAIRKPGPGFSFEEFGRSLRRVLRSVGDRPDSVAALDRAYGPEVSSGAFSLHMPESIEDMPEVCEHQVRLFMDPVFYKYYVEVENKNRSLLLSRSSKNEAAFFSNVRQAINAMAGDGQRLNADGPKLRWLEERLQDFLDLGPLAIYSNWGAYGISLLEELLDKFQVKGQDKFQIITGDTSAAKRTAIVQEYNAGRVPVLLFTAAGSEGMDLKGTRTVVIVEPHWHEARIEQVAARAARRGSHAALPEGERRVDVYRLLLVKPEVVPPGIPDIMRKVSVDQYLHELSLKKKKFMLEVLNPWMRDNSIEALGTTSSFSPPDSMESDDSDSGSGCSFTLAQLQDAHRKPQPKKKFPGKKFPGKKSQAKKLNAKAQEQKFQRKKKPSAEALRKWKRIFK
jgi:hypothetical protein